MFFNTLLAGLLMAQLTFCGLFDRNVHIQLPFFGIDIMKDPVVNRMDCDEFPEILFEPFGAPFLNRRRYQAFNREANEKCSKSSADECLCVTPNMCSDGFIVNDGRNFIKRRGKRNLNTGLLEHMHGLERKKLERMSIDWNENKNFGIFLKPPFKNPDLNEPKKFFNKPNDIETSIIYKTIEEPKGEEKKDLETKNVTDSIEVEETPSKTPSNKDVPEIDGTRRNFCPYSMVCCKPSTEKSKVRKVFEKCGQRRACGIERKSDIFSRRGEADFGEWPWQVALIRKRDDGRRDLLCNGVLIDSEKVLTVAQCFSQNQTDFENIEARVGDLDLSSNVEPRHHKNYEVKFIIRHPNYNSQSLHNDIAIVYLKTHVEMREHIAPICMAKKNEEFPKDSCVISGWIKSYPLLRESYANYLDHKECEIKMQSSKLGPFFSLHSNFICAMDSGVACRMKGGAPLACKREDGSFALVGLLSWGIDCKGDEAEVFTKVQNYYEWFESQEKFPEAQ